VTRIIAGLARGRRLTVPSSGTRPTSDRVREAVFSSLSAVMDFAGLRVLDLYAGSGALGLEALSRGAASAVLVDDAQGAATVAARNVRGLGLAGRVVRADVASFLRRPPESFDLVFLDPPYEVPGTQVQDVLSALSAGWLVQEAVVVVERGARDAGFVWPGGFETGWNRRFGDTVVHRGVWYGHLKVP
jgi:16S rRNA (guanine966-N2)-methyltransferase